jgi:hypothetical protein
MSTSRAALEEAFSDLEAADTTPEREPLAPIVADEPANELAPLGEDAPRETSADQPIEAAEKPAKKMFKDGKYVPVEPAATKEIPKETELVEKPSKETLKLEKAPLSWKPEVREKFAKLSPEIKAEILRRETEIARAQNEAGASRKFQQEFSQTIRPFEALIAGSGVNPLQAVKNLMTTAASLQTGTPAQRANTVANIIKAYGVDIATLDSILAGRQPKPGAAPLDDIQRMIDQRLAPVQQYMSRAQQQEQARQQVLTAESSQTIEQFANDPKNEYYEDVREDMADLLELAAQRGREMTLQEAYNRATLAHPTISKLVERKQRTEQLRAGQSAVERARKAASSATPGTPALGGSRSTPKNRRDALNKAWDDLSA